MLYISKFYAKTAIENEIFPNTVFLNQVHGDKVININSSNYQNLYEGDALITSTKNISLCIKTADCQAVQVIDPINHEIANIHIGWRGLVKAILQKTFEQMLGNTKDYIVNISPSLGVCCSEFSDPYNELPKKYHRYITARDNRYYVDLWGALDNDLKYAGVSDTNRYRECTRCVSKYYSYRRGDTARMYSVIRIID